ncbi:MAG TPA: restriction endonuclease subunit S [Saprospiraceae bacterium]|nr:restriction endonuclease subunit S [Saprospiraceae bacterium]
MIENGLIELPKGWKWSKLGDACEIVSGSTPKGLESISNTGQFQFYKVSDMNLEGNEIRMISSNTKLTSEEMRALKLKVYPEGTVIFPKRGGAILTNKKRVLSHSSSFDLNLMGVLPNEAVLSKFLFYWFQKLDLGKICDGSNVPQINNKNIVPLDFPIPPLEIQEIIISKIEELLSELDKGIENLKMAQQQLKVYRQAVLKWAFEGRLTNENVKAGELPVGWKWVTLDSVSEKITDGEHFRPPTQFSGIPFLSAKDVRDEGVSFVDPLFISNETAKKALLRCKPSRGDILIVSRGATVGRMCIVNTDRTFCLLGSVILIKSNQLINSKFLCHILKSPLANQKMISVSGATAQQAIYLRDIKNIIIPLPSLKDQDQIILEIESRLSVVDKMEESINQSLQQAEVLRQSVLKRAFEGDLLL